jgi:hypothetical protein
MFNQRTAKLGRFAVVGSQADELAYSVELWDDAGQDLERVLARALSAHLAREIFIAARGEHPDARVLLRRGSRTIADSAD